MSVKALLHDFKPEVAEAISTALQESGFSTVSSLATLHQDEIKTVTQCILEECRKNGHSLPDLAGHRITTILSSVMNCREGPHYKTVLEDDGTAKKVLVGQGNPKVKTWHAEKRVFIEQRYHRQTPYEFMKEYEEAIDDVVKKANVTYCLSETWLRKSLMKALERKRSICCKVNADESLKRAGRKRKTTIPPPATNRTT
jgi:hypothetical protein